MRTSENSEIIFMRLVNNLFTAYPTEDHMPPQVHELVKYTRKRMQEILKENDKNNEK